jgi:ferrous-iron efflux pump FieF
MAAASPPLSPPYLPLADAEATRRVAWLSVATAIFLSLLKLGGWAASGSVGLLATLADSGLDLIAALGTLTALKLSGAPPDAEHRYGHGKAEAFASLLQAALVFGSAVLIGREGAMRLFRPEEVRTPYAALAVAALSIVLAAAMVLAQTRVLRRTRSAAIEGDRAHYLADTAANTAAFAGLVLAALFRAPRADAAAGLAVSAWLVWGACKLLKISADTLMDRELGPADRDAIVRLILEDAQIFGIQDLRTRASGPIVHIQAHVALDPRQSVEMAHHLLVKAEGRILARFPAADIMLQPDPDGRAEPHAGAFAQAVREGPAAGGEVTRQAHAPKEGE